MTRNMIRQTKISVDNDQILAIINSMNPESAGHLLP